jgi:hypothetical protein
VGEQIDIVLRRNRQQAFLQGRQPGHRPEQAALEAKCRCRVRFFQELPESSFQNI